MNQADFVSFKVRLDYALGDKGQYPTNRLGHTEFGDVCLKLGELSTSGHTPELVELLLQIGREGVHRPPEWWLRYLLLFEYVENLTLLNRNQLVRLFEEAPPTDEEAQVHLLRFISYRGCSVDWNRLFRDGTLRRLSSKAPLVIADALIWAERFDLSQSIVDQYYSAHGADSNLVEMHSRWGALLGGPAGRDFVEKLQVLIETPPRSPPISFEKVAAFGRRVRMIPETFPRTHIPPPELHV